IIVAIIVFSIIILVHEYGHFKSAKIFGVKVEEFGLGIPPKAKELFKDKDGTKYTLNWLPLGGFVKLKGENPISYNIFDKNKKRLNNENILKKINNNDDIFDIKGKKIDENLKKEIFEQIKDYEKSDSLVNKNPIQQSIIILAGVFLNFVLAFFIFFILFLIGVKPIGVNNSINTNLDLKLIPTLEKAIEIGL
ncbi:MAG: site-2 protease family protein, partial [Candidatus Gracilibacteria bacterium]|nr:site-2 protease family protein [Candidatus Gracilibacteria bacterium]